MALTDVIWPAVALVLGALAFIRTRPHGTATCLSVVVGHELAARISAVRVRVEAIETNPANLKAIVDRANALTSDLNEVKKRVLEIEDVMRETSTGLTTLKNQLALKKMAAGARE